MPGLHPERVQIESMLARGAGIVAVKPIMRGAFSRRALYRHRAKHMIYAVAPAARPVPFPHSASILKRLKWLQKEIEHTAALAEHKGDLGTKLKALYALGRLLWLESRLSGGAVDVTPDLASLLPPEVIKRLEEARARRQVALAPAQEESPEIEERLKWAFERSYRREIATDTKPDDAPAEKGPV